MNAKGAIVRFIVALVALMIIHAVLPYFPPLSFWSEVAAAVFIGGLGYLADEMLGEYLSQYGRAIVGFIVSVGVLAIFFTRFYFPGVGYYHYVISAIVTSVIVAVGDFVLAKVVSRRKIT